MPHLKLETLARLVDEAPTTEERTHLDRCRRCTEELAALRDQTDTLNTMPDMSPPPDLWPELRARLRDEGLVAGRPRTARPLTRAAAALALFLAGTATGFALRGPAPGTPAAPRTTMDAPARTAEGDAAGPTLPLTAGNPAADVDRAQEQFAAALDRYMRANATDAPDPAARLAALDQIVLTTAEALNESPADPVINSYHLTAVAQRNALLQRIAASDEPVF